MQRLGTTLRVVSAVCIAATVSALPSTATANMSLVEDVGATERINYSGKLRMLSQRIAASACNLHSGIAATRSRATLEASGAEFKKIVNALELGDADLAIIGVETRRKTLAALATLRSGFEPIDVARAQLLNNGPDPEAFATIRADNMELLSRAKLLVSELSGQYSDPSAMTQADAMLVDISGRQRMLTQKMSKEACFLWSSGPSTELQSSLAGTMQMFEISLVALRDGMTEAGIKPAPTPEIAAGLETVWNGWTALKPVLESAAAGKAAGADTREDVIVQLDTLLGDMNAVVGLYTAHAKSGL
ncbi:MAG: type IV pili methyl-accepting chemotaxis transducer N-terminal domain-containing protein [Pseudomonadota bacterium]